MTSEFRGSDNSNQPTITTYAGLWRGIFCSSLYGAWICFFHSVAAIQAPERQAVADRGGRCGLTRAVAGQAGQRPWRLDGQGEQPCRDGAWGTVGLLAVGHVREQCHLLPAQHTLFSME